MRGKGNRLKKKMDEWGLVNELMEFRAYCCAERRDTEATVAGS